MGVTHLALDLGARHERSDRVDDDDVERARPDQHVGDLECLLTAVGLGHQQRVGVDAELLGVLRVERVLGVNEGSDATAALRVGDRVQRHGRLTGRLRAKDLHNPPAREATEPQRHIERDRAARDDLDWCAPLVTEPHHRTLAMRALDLSQSVVECLGAICCSHVRHP